MPNYNKRINDTSARIGEVRFSYTYVFKRRRNEDGSEGKYGVCLVIPKDDKQTVALIQECINAAKEKGKADKWNGKIPANCKSPLRDGDIDREDDENFAGCWFINANSNNAPGVRVLEDGVINEAIGEEDFYSGCWGAASVNFFPYDASGNRGVACGLNNVIKTRDDTRLSGGRSADEDFGDLGAIDPLS